MRSLIPALMVMALLAAAAVAIGMALPLIRSLYEQSVFLWISLAGAAGAAALLIIAPIRARVPTRRKLIFLGLAAAVAMIQTVRVYADHGSPSLWIPTPQVLSFFRELVHILEYGFLAFIACRFLQPQLGGPLLYLTALAYAFLAGLADETVQWLHAFRVGDIRDVIFNGTSACIGLLYRAGLEPVPPRHATVAGRYLSVLLLGLSPLLSLEFYLRTQTGHEICDRELNCFQSHFTAPELHARDVERARRWQGLPFGSLVAEDPKFWEREDYFLTEARAHLRMANQALSASDSLQACGELGVLMTHFSSSLGVLGVTPQSYSCREPVRGFRSRAFPELDTNAEPARLYLTAGLAAFSLALTAWLLARSPAT